MKRLGIFRNLTAGLLAAVLMASGTANAAAIIAHTPKQITNTPADDAAAAAVVREALKAKPVKGASGANRTIAYSSAGTSVAPTPPVLAPITEYFPADVTNNGGQVLQTAVSHAVYVNCTSVTTCWGNPEQFLTDLGASSFIHLVDQYVNTTTANRYTDGQSFSLSYTAKRGFGFGGKIYGSRDIMSILHTAVVNNGKASGYGHIYHIFLPQGTDVCLTQAWSSPTCYSPDYPYNFAFCAYHASADFSDVGHVIYTVEPYQNVTGCVVPQPSTAGYPNSQLADSTNSTLSHELFESISDPDQSAWYVTASADLSGEEIADLCQNAQGKVGQFTANGNTYLAQLEYSNLTHSCRQS